VSVHASQKADGAPRRPVSILDLHKARESGERFAMLTAYDFLSAQILDEAGIPVILVGDSLGMVMLGYDSTVPVTLDEMIHHTRAVVRGAPNALVVGDMPFGTYQAGPEQALASATRFLKETGCNAVKLEGGGRTIESTRLLVDSGIPVMAHLGLTPQSVNQFGGFKVQGKSDEARAQILADAHALQEAGAFALVLECVPADLAEDVTAALDIPTIGIGAGAGTDGQVLVWHDLLGLTSGHLPRFVKQYVDMRSQITDAVKAYAHEVSDATFPAHEHTY
jgi:3-methyl-2-oxobutanoate hydroxymethyltransferase